MFINPRSCENRISVERLNILNTDLGCSYGGELVRLGRLARLSEMSPFLRNSYKNIKMFKWEASQPAEVRSHLILPRSHLGEMKIFHMNTRKWASPARRYKVVFNHPCFVIRTFVLHDGFTSMFICKNYLIKQSFSSDITNVLSELR